MRSFFLMAWLSWCGASPLWAGETATATMALKKIDAPSPARYGVDPPGGVRGSSFGTAPKAVATSRSVVLEDSATSSGVPFLSMGFLADFVYPEPSQEPGAPTYVPVPGPQDTLIPERVRKYHGKTVTVKGYMMPLEIASDRTVKKFLLLPDQGLCCFGRMPRVNEYVAVKMAPDASGAPAKQDVPVLVTGVLDVGGFAQDGYLLGLYKMQALTVDVPKSSR